MATAQLYEVTTFDEAHSSTNKTETDLKEYQELTYNNRDDEGILELITQYDAKVAEIVGDVEEIGKVYDRIKGVYQEFDTEKGDFETAIDKYYGNLNGYVGQFGNRSKDLTQTAFQKIEKMSKEDNTLLDDVEMLSDMLGIDYDDAEAPSATFIS